MRNFIKKSFYGVLFAALFLCLLFYPALSLFYATRGLTLWFSKMIPTLLPFMILSTLLIRLNLHQSFISVLTPVLRPIFGVNASCLYCIVAGFFCGFPMGAKIAVDLYLAGKITKTEGEYLLSFCNNIGPVYFISFVLLSLSIQNPMPFLFGMYGIPLCYGILLRHTVYRGKLQLAKAVPTKVQAPLSFFAALDDAIISSLSAITKLGGYMILFNLCSCIPVLLFKKSPFLKSIFGCLFEITGGIQYTLDQSFPFSVSCLIIFPFLLFGGFSCLAQTASILRGTDISPKKYCIHKLIQYFIALLYYVTIINLN